MTLKAPTEAIILAGGMGTRLRSVVSDVPKPMAPVGGRPFLEYLMDYWIEQGIERFCLSVGYLGAIIREHFGKEYRECLIDYIVEQDPLGTGGGLKQAINAKTWTSPEVVVVNGDTWFEVDLAKLIQDYQVGGAPISIALKRILENDRYGAVGVDQNQKITEFGIKTHGTCFINGGCYLLNASWLREQMGAMPEKFSLEQDFLVPMAAQRLVSASPQDVTFLDIGIPEDYRQASDVISQQGAI
jgi:D-glycero-alpha-D-manno-heptose 1-phosphate guanylyltransferase